MPWAKIEHGPFAGIETDVDVSRCGACRNGSGNHVHPQLPEHANGGARPGAPGAPGAPESRKP